MKDYLKIFCGIILLIFLCKTCASDNSVDSLYGTYVGTDYHGNTISITLSPESENEWRKYGTDNSSTLVYKDSYGRLQSTPQQSITWTWDLDEGYVKTFYLGNLRTIIDTKDKKFYHSWGNYIDKRNGTPYKKY